MSERADPATRRPPRRTDILVLGAGPAGLEAALAARAHGYGVALLERSTFGASIRRWSHVRLFSPWRFNTSELGRRLLDESGHTTPDPDGLPTGADFVRQYLEPLAHSSILKPHLFEHVEALGASRRAFLKGERLGSSDRMSSPFIVTWRDHNGIEGRTEARVLIDATGVFGQPNAAGAGGCIAPGEAGLANDIVRHVPDVLGRDRDHYENQRVIVVGGGYSAATCVRDLAQLSAESSNTRVTWVSRTGRITEIPNDPLAERLELTRALGRLARGEAGEASLDVVAGYVVERIDPGQLTVRHLEDDSSQQLRFDRLVSMTGYHPDLSLTRELQVHHCWATDGPMKLAASLMQASEEAGGNCLDVATGPGDTLRNPEPQFFVIGSKSYGRSSLYLLRSGIEQIDALFSGLIVEPGEANR